MVKKECFSELIDHGHGNYTLFGRVLADTPELQDLKKPATPLVLQSQGSFTVGGDIVFSDALGAGGNGHIAVNQMYVQYKVPPSSRMPDGSWRRPQRQVLRDDA